MKRNWAVLLSALVLTGCARMAHNSVDSKHDAYAAVIAFLDFSHLHQVAPPESDVSISLEHPASDLTPFVRDRIIGHAIWRVHFDKVNIQHQHVVRGKDMSLARACTVYLDSANGDLLSVALTREWSNDDLRHKVDTALFRKRSRNWTGDKVHLRRTPAPVGFFEAGGAAVASNANHAVEVIGILTQVHDSLGPDAVQWWIMGKGVPRSPMFGGDGFSPYTWEWSSVSAVDARLLCAGTDPL